MKVLIHQRLLEHILSNGYAARRFFLTGLTVYFNFSEINEVAECCMVESFRCGSVKIKPRAVKRRAALNFHGANIRFVVVVVRDFSNTVAIALRLKSATKKMELVRSILTRLEKPVYSIKYSSVKASK